MSSLWNALGVDALAEHVGGVVNRASELAKDVITDDIDDEDEGEVQSRALFSTAGERDEALQVRPSKQHHRHLLPVAMLAPSVFPPLCFLLPISSCRVLGSALARGCSARHLAWLPRCVPACGGVGCGVVAIGWLRVPVCLGTGEKGAGGSAHQLLGSIVVANMTRACHILVHHAHARDTGCRVGRAADCKYLAAVPPASTGARRRCFAA
jgi:hypothetical protein